MKIKILLFPLVYYILPKGVKLHMSDLRVLVFQTKECLEHKDLSVCVRADFDVFTL